jgi:glutamate N-acetyltransferase/amino-acid N-acetyltransferase
MAKTRHITLPKGFIAAGVKCGIKTTDQEDLSIIASEADASVAIVTTRNQVVGAPVVWCRRILPRGYGTARGIVINSGCANVCTGAAGLKDAETMAHLVAKHLGTSPEKMLVASTGIIGQRLPMAKISKGIDSAASHLGTAHDAAALRGMMTTDTQEKSAVVQAMVGTKRITIAGIAKGSGMLAPSMATMIAVLTTDATVTTPALHKALTGATATSFNAVTIDSDTSTSDTVAIFASGAAGNKPLTARSRGYSLFAAALKEVCMALAYAIAADGEGATKTIAVHVCGARSDADAELAAKSVANSPLFKCAVHGADPNVGRIAVGLGKSAARIVPEKLSVKIGGFAVVTRGVVRKFDRPKVKRYMSGSEIEITCNLGIGKGKFTALTCDLSHEYVSINADYHT